MDVTKTRAAEWIARLHAEDCTELDHDRFRDWLASDPRNGPVFEHLTELWELAGGVTSPSVTAPHQTVYPRRNFSRRHALAGLVATIFLAVPPGKARMPAGSRKREPAASAISASRPIPIAASIPRRALWWDTADSRHGCVTGRSCSQRRGRMRSICPPMA